MYNNRLIHRDLSETMKEMFQYLPVITLTGPRQSGKTTLCRELFPELPYTNFEDAATLHEVQEDPKEFFAKYPEGVIIDEAHNYPEIFSYIQVEVDEDRHQGKENRRFIVTGSSNFALLEKVTQSMAGRTAVLTLLPLSLKELLRQNNEISTPELIINGGYPAIWRNGTNGRQVLYSSYYTTYIERDVRSLINIKDMRAFQTFIRLCAGRIGSEFNASALSVEVGVSVNTINSWISVLAASYIVYLLPSYHANIGKRLTKTPKLYFYDTGMATFLLGIANEEHLSIHPLRGALFENMVINEMMKEGTNKGKEEYLYFYRDKTQREVDVIRMKANNIEAYEIKAGMTYDSDYFKHLKYLQELLKDRITRTAVIYDGKQENDKAINGIYNFRNFHLDS